MPAKPSPADYGALDYYMICMACHGDRGQGLTDEWRSAWGADGDCWQSKCHAANHPPEGFDLPHTSPAILGEGTLLSYADAWDLYQRILGTMPWWDPGSLSETQTWNLTSHLLRERGELPYRLTLDAGSAVIVRLHSPAAARPDERPWALALAALLIVAAIAMIGHRDKDA